MTPQEKLRVLIEHEFDLKEDLKTFVCVTCGKQGRNPKKLTHRPGCLYAALLADTRKEAAQ